MTGAAAFWVLIGIFAQASDDERLKKLEEQVRQQQQEIDQLKKKPAAGAEGGVSASASDGLRVRTADGNLDVHVGGRFQEHYRDVFDRPQSAKTVPDSFYIRAARLKVDGTFYKEFGFQVEGDFPSSATGPTPTLQTAFVEWKKLNEFRLMAGQFKAPMSQERLRSRLFSDFVEDDILTRFVPGYDIGLQAYGSIADGFTGYQVAVTNGRSHLDNQGRTRNDDNDTKELIARWTLSPWAPDKESFLRGLRLGVSGSITRVSDVPVTGAAGVATPTNFDITSPELSVTLYDPVGTTAVNLDGRRSRAQAELSWAVGPVCLRSEYLVRRDHMASALAGATIPTTSWNASLTWIATGEEKLPETRITPTTPFNLEGGWGAVELAVRVAGWHTSERVEDIGLVLTGQTNEITSFSFGVNWWLTRNLRVSADLVQERYHQPINFGGGRSDDVLNGFLARFQIDF